MHVKVKRISQPNGLPLSVGRSVGAVHIDVCLKTARSIASKMKLNISLVLMTVFVLFCVAGGGDCGIVDYFRRLNKERGRDPVSPSAS